MPQIWQYNTYAEYYSISRALCCAKGQKMGQKLIQVFFISRSSTYILVLSILLFKNS